VYEVGDYGRFTDKDLFYVRLCTLDEDLNCDEIVDEGDLAIFAGALAGPDAPAVAGSDPTDFVRADFAGDGDVDLADFAVLQVANGSGVE
jgi:hypothetical protein